MNFSQGIDINKILNIAFRGISLIVVTLGVTEVIGVIVFKWHGNRSSNLSNKFVKVGVFLNEIGRTYQ